MAKKTYVLDTSVCLTDANCIYQYQNNDIVLPLKVLEEIDGHKNVKIASEQMLGKLFEL